MMKVAIVGTRGIPNNYGGFEALAENLVEYLGTELDISVYCSSADMPKTKDFKKARLIYIPISSHGFWGIIYDSISLLHALFRNDKILILGFGSGYMLQFFKWSKQKVIVNIGGLDWKRSKWSPFAQKVIRLSEKLLINNCGTVVSDNEGISQYIAETYQRDCVLIAYGADQASKVPVTEAAIKRYPFLAGKYCFTITRVQPDNNIDLMLEACSRLQKMIFVIVGNWDVSAYGKNVRKAYESYPNLILLDAIFDETEKNLLRSNCTFYIHGHSAGGTNPSLVEAMYLELPIFAFGSVYNKFATENKAIYYNNAAELTALIENYETVDLVTISKNLKAIANQKYLWKIVAAQYKAVFTD